MIDQEYQKIEFGKRIFESDSKYFHSILEQCNEVDYPNKQYIILDINDIGKRCMHYVLPNGLHVYDFKPHSQETIISAVPIPQEQIISYSIHKPYGLPNIKNDFAMIHTDKDNGSISNISLVVNDSVNDENHTQTLKTMSINSAGEITGDIEYSPIMPQDASSLMDVLLTRLAPEELENAKNKFSRIYIDKAKLLLQQANQTIEELQGENEKLTQKARTLRTQLTAIKELVLKFIFENKVAGGQLLKSLKEALNGSDLSDPDDIDQ